MDLEGAYERGLKLGQPADDPSWMRTELGREWKGPDLAQVIEKAYRLKP